MIHSASLAVKANEERRLAGCPKRVYSCVEQERCAPSSAGRCMASRRSRQQQMSRTWSSQTKDRSCESPQVSDCFICSVEHLWRPLVLRQPLCLTLRRWRHASSRAEVHLQLLCCGCWNSGTQPKPRTCSQCSSGVRCSSRRGRLPSPARPCPVGDWRPLSAATGGCHQQRDPKPSQQQPEQ